MSYSLWAVNSHSTVVGHYILNGGGSQEVKNKYYGECLLWKAMAYFYLVRTFGDVPIVHDVNSMLECGSYNSQRKVQKADVYEYMRIPWVSLLIRGIRMLLALVLATGMCIRCCRAPM